MIAEGHILHVGFYTKINRDRHVGKVFEERFLPGPTAPAVKVAALSQSREGVPAGSDFDYWTCWEVV